MDSFFVLANYRAEGNAPLPIQAIADALDTQQPA
jgi:hypothetical protein